MAMVSQEIATSLMHEIQKIEKGTDLERVAVISRIGMSIASATSDSVDADAETASSSALVDLSERLSKSVQHGNLREILVKSEKGFVILQFINEEYMVFGGISNPLRVGYYMEYLRNLAHKFAFILAGNRVTDELKKEIEANRDRDFRMKQEAKAPLSADFKMDKSNETDKTAMEGVLSFLKEWGGEDETSLPNENNIVGIDDDVMFGLDNLAPTPITPSQITQAQPKSTGNNMEDIFSALDNIGADSPSPLLTPSAPSTPPIDPMAPQGQEMDDLISSLDQFTDKATPISPTSTPSSTPESSLDDILGVLDDLAVGPQNATPTTKATSGRSIDATIDDGGIPDDILAELNEISETTTTKVTSSKSRQIQQQQSFRYGIPIYKNEVPPVPLKDYVTFEIGSLTGSEPTTTTQEYTQPVPTSAPTYSASEQPSMQQSAPKPDFEAIASEYDDVDLDIEEDAMLQALEELDFDKIGKEKKH
ncbi:MAG: roadblock/LC7 domain-containing protein [Promethearchaeota archaeon]